MVLAEKQTHRLMDQNREPEINLCIFDQGAKNTQCRKDSRCNKGCWQN